MAYTKKQLEEKRDYARILYMQGDSQKVIAEKTGVSEQSVTKWAAAGGWKEKRAAQNVSRGELVNKILRAVDKLLEDAGKEDAVDIALADRLCKFASTIEKLDKRTNVVETIDVFTSFTKWLQYQSQFDEAITPELLKTFNQYHNQYINRLMQSHASRSSY